MNRLKTENVIVRKQPYGQTDGQTDGQTTKRTDRLTDAQTVQVMTILSGAKGLG